MSDKKCPKCGAGMEEGYVPDFGHGPPKLRRLLSGHWLATNCSSRVSP